MIEQDLSYRPRVPRETRRLLVAALIALLSIWALARVRFPDRPAAPNPVAPLLSQLGPRMRFEDLASQLAGLRPKIEAALHPLGDAGPTALRVRDGMSLALADADRAGAVRGVQVKAADRASGLVVIETGISAPTPPLAYWSPDRLDQPRYLIAALTGRNGLRMIPVLTTALAPVSNPLWQGSIWMVTGDVGLPPGAFVFTEDAQLVGLAWEDGGRLAIVPAATMMAEADRILAAQARTPGWLGVAVSPLTPPLARATGASTGVVVSWVDARGPSFGALHIGDVIETVDGESVRSPLDWRARERRFPVEGAVRLGVRRKGTVRELSVTPAAPPSEARRLTLGLELRRVREGSEILQVEAGSVADGAGLRRGDVIIHAGDVTAPTPAGVRQLFAATAEGQPLLIAIARDGTHHAMTLEKDAPERP